MDMSDQMNLFSAAASAGGHSHAPLADRMRPQTLDEIVGQDALIGKGKLLRRAIETNRLSSIIRLRQNNPRFCHRKSDEASLCTPQRRH